MTTARQSQSFKHIEKREQILSVAASIISGKSYSDTSLKDIATGVNLQKQSLYHYFASKEDLFYQILEAAILKAIKSPREANRLSINPIAKLRRIIISYTSLFYTDEALMKVFAQEKWDMIDSKLRIHIIDLQREYDNIVQDVLRQGIREKMIKADIDIKIVSFAIIGMIYHMGRWYSSSGRLPIGNIADEWVKLILKGLLVGASNDGYENAIEESNECRGSSSTAVETKDISR